MANKMHDLYFFLVILAANVIQGITGFAGTVVAMPLSLMLVGYQTAKPVLNVLGLLSGIYVFVTSKGNVCWKEWKRIIIVMAIGIMAGFGLKGLLLKQGDLLYKVLGIFVICLALQGAYQMHRESPPEDRKRAVLILLLAGVAHGVFVAGGPVLIGYLANKVPEKVNFRATISTVWMVLNSVVLIDDIRAGLWDLQLARVQVISLPFWLAGMALGGVLYCKMNQRTFMQISYLLLFVSGITLLIK